VPQSPLELAVRLLAALLSLFLWYRALGAPGQGWGGGRPVVARRLAFGALGAVLVFLLAGGWFPKTVGSPGRGFEAYVTGSLAQRAALGGVTFPSRDADAGERGLAGIRRASERLPESVHLRRHLAVSLAEAGKYPEALRVVQEAMDALAARAPERAAAERAVWESLYGPRPPTRAALGAAERRLAEWRLGWLGRVALLAAHRRLGAPPDALAREVAAQGRAYFRRLAVAGAWVVLLLPQLGLIVLGVALVLIRTGVLRPAPPARGECGPVLWESFLLMLALGVLPAFLPGRPTPETQPGAYAALLLARDVVQVLAVGYLWWRLRTGGWSLAEVGLTTRGLGREMGIGVLAALVVIPAAFLIAALTKVLSDRYFPFVAPPYHPLQGMTATSTSPEIRAALFIAAVVGAPVLEEIFFRGALFGALRRRFGFWPGLLGSAGVFAVLHPQLPLGFLPIAVLGAAFAVLYHWRQSLVAPMVVHAINNGLAFGMMNLLFPM